MTEQFVKTIFDFFKSQEFTAIITSAAAVFAIIYPLIRPFLKARTEAKIQNALEQARIISSKYQELEHEFVSVAKNIDSLLKQLENQKEALLIAFDSSNLDYSAKKEVKALLEQTIIPEVKEKPVEEKKEIVVKEKEKEEKNEEKDKQEEQEEKKLLF